MYLEFDRENGVLHLIADSVSDAFILGETYATIGTSCSASINKDVKLHVQLKDWRDKPEPESKKENS